MSRPKLSLIAAVSKNGVIGRDQKLPWDLPEDLKRFKEITYGAPVIMGRKTYESIGRLLPGRKNIIITRSLERIVPNAWIVPSLEEAIRVASSEVPEVFILGGAEIYKISLPTADRVYLTEIDLTIEGDAYFPGWPDLPGYHETKREERPSADGKPSFRFLVFDRN